jgi:TNF receptor-associated protein 1
LHIPAPRPFSSSSPEDKKPDVGLIGQFGVGFYSAFMVAKKVTVLSRSFVPEEQGWQWTSEGMGGYELAPAADLPRGTKITLELKDDAKDFAQAATWSGSSSGIPVSCRSRLN